MSFAGQWARNTCRNLFFCATLVVAQAAIAASWNYLGGPFGGQPLTLFNDAAGNTWAGLNGSGGYYRPAGSVEWRARPGLPTQSNTKITVDAQCWLGWRQSVRDECPDWFVGRAADLIRARIARHGWLRKLY